jgi:hypothetical protein
MLMDQCIVSVKRLLLLDLEAFPDGVLVWPVSGHN